MRIRRANARGHEDHGWLSSFHTFSFADYYDPEHMGFHALRVLNEDRVAPGRGFGWHTHRDMEIISYVLEGSLMHKDSMGNGSTIGPGEVQRMSAGSGIMHSELNASEQEPLHFLQIWILPERRGMPPSYEQKYFPHEERQGRLRLLATGEAAGDCISIHQDVNLYASLLEPGARLSHEIAAGRHGWLHVARGDIQIDGERLSAGDAAALEHGGRLEVAGQTPAEVLLFDLA